MSNRSALVRSAIALSASLSAHVGQSSPPPVVPVCHTPPDRPFATRKDIRHIGGTRKVKKQGKGTASNDLYHPLQKPRLDARKTYRELEAMINPPPEFKVVGCFKIYE